MNLIQNLEILFGCKEKQIDVKDIFLDKFYDKNNLVYIPYQTDFNSHFGDPCFGKIKKLSILNNGILIKEIDENTIKKKCYRFNIFSGKQPLWTTNDILAIINFYDYDVSWAKKLKIPYIIYYKEQDEERPFSAENKAKSETNLLKFIVDFYDYLPKYIVNLHQYNIKHYWIGDMTKLIGSKKDLVNKIQHSNTKGFMSLIPYTLGNLEKQIPPMKISGWWDGTMKRYFGNIERYGNYTLKRGGCAVFMVARENIRSLPKEFYQNMYDWLCKNSIGNLIQGTISKNKTRKPSRIDLHPNSHWYTSRYMEWSWEFIFTRKYIVDDSRLIIKNTPSLYKITYGNNLKTIDVTEKFTNTFIKNNRIIVPKGTNFNDFFGDPVKNTLKYIVYLNNQKCYVVSETDNYYQDLVIDIF